MSHCVSCDSFLTDTELMMELPNGEQENMCHHCRGIAFNPHSCDVHHYQFQELTEFGYLIIGKIDNESDYD